MNSKYTTDYILSFEDTVQQQRFEELEETVRMYKQFTHLYEENAKRCRKVLLKIPVTSETQQILGNINIIENRLNNWRMKKCSFDQEKKERRIIKPSPSEMERLKKSMSLPVIKIEQSSQRTAETKLFIKEFEGQYYQMTKHSTGNDLLLKLIEYATKEELETILGELDPHLEQLIVHQNGQYVLPKMMEKGVDTINDFIFSVVTKHLVKYCCDRFGGYTVQKIAPFLTDKYIQLWRPILKENICTLLLDQHGNYVVQTLMKLLKEEDCDFFYEGVPNHIMEIATSKIGCSVLTNAINNSTPQQLKKIKESLIEHCKELIIDQYGNFILQHLIDNDTTVLLPILDCILDNILFYCNHKFSSNVVEKCLLTTLPHQASEEIMKKKEELITSIMNGKNITILLENQYGNFVIQALIDSLPKEKQIEMTSHITPYLSSHSHFSYYIEKKLKTSIII